MTAAVAIKSPRRAQPPTVMERVAAWALAYRAIMEVLIQAGVPEPEYLAAEVAAKLVVGTRD